VAGHGQGTGGEGRRLFSGLTISISGFMEFELNVVSGIVGFLDLNWFLN